MTKESGEIIKRFLQRYHMTVTTFASVTDLSRWTVHKYLKGGNIQPKAAKKINKAILFHYGVSLPIKKLLE